MPFSTDSLVEKKIFMVTFFNSLVAGGMGGVILTSIFQNWITERY